MHTLTHTHMHAPSPEARTAPAQAETAFISLSSLSVSSPQNRRMTDHPGSASDRRSVKHRELEVAPGLGRDPELLQAQ